MNESRFGFSVDVIKIFFPYLLTVTRKIFLRVKNIRGLAH